VLYFVGGAVMDWLVATYYVQIGASRVFLASILAMLITIFSVLVINGILDRANDKKRKMALLMAYALGNGIGTAFAVVMK
jgi:hypothetical protein